MSENTNELEKEQNLISSNNINNYAINSENNSNKNKDNSEINKENKEIIKENNTNIKELTNQKEDNNNAKNNKEIKKNEGGGFMITELLNINDNKQESPKNAFLKEKYPEINNSSSLQKAIQLELKKSHEDLRKKFLENNLTLNNNKSSYNKQLNLFLNTKKSLGKSSKLLKILKENEKSLSMNISKLTSQQKTVEGLSIPKEDKVGHNNREYNLKIIKNNKENLMKKLERIKEQIKEVIIKENNTENKQRTIPDYRILDDNQEEYNKHLIEIGKASINSTMKYRSKMKSSYEKRKNEIDLKEKQILELKEKNFKEKIINEKQLIAKRKKKNDDLTNNINKYIQKKANSPDNYIFYKFKEQYEEKQKKLLDKIHLMKKEPVMRKNDFEELAKKVNEQKRLMEIDNEEKKKKLLELWLYRSETLPSYHHPLIKYVEEEEKNKRREWNEIEKKRKECNDLEKRNFKPPKITINRVLRKQIEIRKMSMNRDNIRKIANNNKNLRFKYSPIRPITRKNMQHQLSFDKFKNKNNLNKKNTKKILKPIKITSQKSDNPRDYLREILKSKRVKSPSKTAIVNFSDILENNNNNIVESLMTAKNQIEKIDDKYKRKKELLNLNDDYSKDVSLVDQVGKLLIDSVQSKISILSKICEK